jgi:hypothetical protein
MQALTALRSFGFLEANGTWQQCIWRLLPSGHGTIPHPDTYRILDLLELPSGGDWVTGMSRLIRALDEFA